MLIDEKTLAVFIPTIVLLVLSPGPDMIFITAILFSLTFLPQFAHPARGPVWAQIIVLGVILSIIMLTIVIPIALTSGHLGQWFASRPKAALALGRAMGGALIGLAAWVFQSSRYAR